MKNKTSRKTTGYLVVIAFFVLLLVRCARLTLRSHPYMTPGQVAQEIWSATDITTIISLFLVVFLIVAALVIHQWNARKDQEQALDSAPDSVSGSAPAPVMPESTLTAQIRTSAERGYAINQYKLGMMYQNGQGVPMNNELAAFWLRRAAEQGNAAARKALDEMQPAMKTCKESL